MKHKTYLVSVKLDDIVMAESEADAIFQFRVSHTEALDIPDSNIECVEWDRTIAKDPSASSSASSINGIKPPKKE